MMNILKTFLKFFLIGLLILSIFCGGCIGMYYAAMTHWALGMGVMVVFFSIIMGGIGILIYEII